jgi:hypothetical protein
MSRNKYLNDQGVDIARGLVLGTEVRNIFGFIPATNNTDAKAGFVPVWELGTAYTYPTVAVQLDVQTAATDTATIKIIGLDENFNGVEEVVVLNGIIATDQTTNNSFYRVNDVITIAGNATGNITIVQTGTSDVVAQVIGGTGRNQAAIYTVPAGCDFYLTRINCFGADVGTSGPQERTHRFRNFVQLPSGVILRVAELAFHNSFDIYRTNPFRYTTGTDVQFQMRTANAGDNELSVFGEGFVVKRGPAQA